MERENPETRSAELNAMADRLDELQKVENEGRGISCVQDVILFLRRGKFEDARATAEGDHDKIRYYPEIERVMEGYGLCESDETYNKRWKQKLRQSESEE